MRHWFDENDVYPFRHDVQLLDDCEHVLHGCWHNEHTLPIA